MIDSANNLPSAFAVPPRLPTRRASSRVWMGIVAATLVACCALLFFFNPAQHGFYPQCAFHQMTGWQCPGCGGLRAVHQLLHGHVLTALHLNVLAVLAFPLMGLFLFRKFLAQRFGINWERFFTTRWVWSGIGLMILFSVLRNLPAFAFLSP